MHTHVSTCLQCGRVNESISFFPLFGVDGFRVHGTSADCIHCKKNIETGEENYKTTDGTGLIHKTCFEKAMRENKLDTPAAGNPPAQRMLAQYDSTLLANDQRQPPSQMRSYSNSTIIANVEGHPPSQTQARHPPQPHMSAQYLNQLQQHVLNMPQAQSNSTMLVYDRYHPPSQTQARHPPQPHMSAQYLNQLQQHALGMPQAQSNTMSQAHTAESPAQPSVRRNRTIRRSTDPLQNIHDINLYADPFGVMQFHDSLQSTR